MQILQSHWLNLLCSVQEVVFKLTTFSHFSELSEEDLEIHWITQFQRRLEEGHSPALQTKLFYEMMSARSRTQVSMVSVCHSSRHLCFVFDPQEPAETSKGFVGLRET